MTKLIVPGTCSLKGEIKIDGAKNSALAIMVAAIIAKEEVILDNIPQISDVNILVEIMQSLGIKVTWLEDNVLSIYADGNIEYRALYDSVKKLRASNLLLGAMVAKLNRAQIALPGGCEIGTRPMDLHIKGLTKLGCEIEIDHGSIQAVCKKLLGNQIYLDFPSVGATENLMMAACVSEGQTVLENAAKEPEIVDLANFLNAMGAKIRGAGTDLIKIEGVSELNGTRHSIIPDRIEAGTFMVAAAITTGDLLIKNVIPTHVKPVTAKLKEAGAYVEEFDTEIRVTGGTGVNPIDIKTLPYPGFPTDMQSQMLALMTVGNGTSVIIENVFENRLQIVDEIKRMGADIKVEGRTAIVTGVKKLSGAEVKATDLRSGAALVLAALRAEGESVINNLEIIDRGYLKLEEKFNLLGARIKRKD